MRDPGMKYFTPESVGPKRHKTHDGFLVCEDVPLARTGEQLYRPEETPVEPAPGGGPTIIERREDEVFNPRTIASFNGKPVVYEHPTDDVTPETYAMLAKGHVMNPHRGQGALDQFIVGDLFITDAATMMAIEQGKREVSCGYAADFYQIAPGRGGQRNIIGNHVALVDRGRCGSECAINDQSKVCDCHSCEEKRKTTMAKKTTFEDRIMAFFGVKDRAALDKKLSEEATEESEVAPGVHVHIGDGEGKEYAAMDKRIKDLETGMAEVRTGLDAFRKTFDEAFEKKKATDAETEEEKKEREKKEKEAKDADPDEKEKAKAKETEDALEEEAPKGTGDKARKAKDSAYLADSFQQTVAFAEILAPGINIPIFDKAMEPRKTHDAMCGFRRTALELGYNNPATRGVIDSVLAGKGFDLKPMNCHDVRNLFIAAGVIQKDKNTAAAIANAGRNSVNGDGKQPKRIQTVAELQQANADFYNPGKAH